MLSVFATFLTARQLLEGSQIELLEHLSRGLMYEKSGSERGRPSALNLFTTVSHPPLLLADMPEQSIAI